MTTNTPCSHHRIVQLEQGDTITAQCTRCGKKMKVVKKPSCSCYGGFDCEVCNPDYYKEMKTTDTPRTDACQKCNGTGWYKYDHDHSTICNQCCLHNKGWWNLTKEFHGSHYIDGEDNACCKAGCGTMRRDTKQ